MNALFVISGLAVMALLAEIAQLKKWLVTFVMFGLVAALFLIFQSWNASAYYFHDMMLFDSVALNFSALIIITTLIWFFAFSGYFNIENHKTDRTSLVLFAVAGGVIMTAFNNMAMLFLGIEILSLSLYVLAGSRKDSISSTEAAFKYFLMGSFATGFLLFGITLVYGATGSFNITDISATLSDPSVIRPGFFQAGMMLMLIGLAFKISAVPFHFWAPDVYEGAPTPITALMATVVKIGAMAAFYRIFAVCFAPAHPLDSVVVKSMMVITLLLPNITAIYQRSVKRMLAYSSVGHVGYLLLALVAGGDDVSGVILYYLAAYAIASLASFYIIYQVDTGAGNNGLMGLYKRNPLLAATMATALMSLAGIPPLAGFFGKYRVFALAINEGLTGYVILAIFTSLAGVYYYFKVIVNMFFDEPAGKTITLKAGTIALLVLLLILMVGLGLFPDLLFP